MSKTATRPSLAQRLAAVAGPPTTPMAAIEKIEKAAVSLQAPRTQPKPRAETAPAAPTPAATAKARVGKTMVAGYFSKQMAKAVKLLAVERDTTVQALIGEGLDAVLHKYGKHPMGER